MKRFFAFLLCLAALVCCSACRTEYRQDLSPVSLADYLERELPLGSMRTLDDKSEFYGRALALDGVDSFALRIAEDGSNLDEFGIFACVDENAAKALATELENHLAFLYKTNREWYLSYIPKEVPKLQNAEVKTYGRYVAYSILNENERNRVFDLLRQKLLQAKET